MENQGNSTKRIAQRQRREALLLEGITGKTKKDTLPATAYPWTDEAQAMYFKGARDFLKTSLAYIIMCGHQDIIGEMKI